jgi:hypothetical protein
MFGKMLEMSGRSKAVFGLTAGLLLLGGRAASADTTLFTTIDDFSGWNNSGGIVTGTEATPDYDGSAVNGLGNTSTGSGNPGVPGSLSVTANSGTYDFFYSQGEQGNAPFLAALGGSGTLKFEFQYPVNNGGSYFQLGMVVNSSATFYQAFGGTAVSDGGGWYTESIPYSFTTSPTYSYFQLGLIFNSNYDSGAPTSFPVDDIAIAAVPEPATLSVLGMGLSLLTIRRRRRA